jgi:cytochrome P450
MKDDQYRGYDIPADTMIIPNIWSVDITISTAFSSYIICNRAMTRDEQIYPEAELFNPDRFMDQNGTEADQPDPKDFIFGFGRRQVALTCLCPFRPPDLST